MSFAHQTRSILVLCATFGAGCSSRMPLPDHTDVPELAAVPFFPQTAYDCGPAALATILGAVGVDVTATELIDLVYVEDLQGSLQVELVAAKRRFGRVPMPIGPRFEDLLVELESGRPVLVLQNLGFARAPVWHYAVVVGFDAEAGRVILRSGAEPRRRERIDRFLRRWGLADNWGFVASPPREIPASATPDRYMRALVGSQHRLDVIDTGAAFEAALLRWPEEPLVLFLAAAHKHEETQLAAAAILYKRLLTIEPEHAAARNNLANVLLDLGCREEALRQARLASAQPLPGGAFDAAIADTLLRIESAPADPVGLAACASPG
jgi:hypothetical protein